MIHFSDDGNATADSAVLLQHLTLAEQFMPNSAGDLIDLMRVLFPSLGLRNDLAALLSSHCSVLVKPARGNRELISGHTTWSLYSYMLRVYKVYDFPLHAPGTKAVRVSFSGYPGETNHHCHTPTSVCYASTRAIGY